MSYLLGTERQAARLSPLGLTVARMGVAALPITIYLGLRLSGELLAVLRRWPWRILLCGVLGGPVYNLAVFSGIARGLPPPVASVITTLVPLVVVILSAVFLAERISFLRWLGVIVGLAGVMVIAFSRGVVGASYPLTVAIALMAPIAWSVYTVVTKNTFQREGDGFGVSPLLWTYAGIVVGAGLLVPFAPRVANELRALDIAGWLAVGYLAIPCTVFGFALWTWLLQHLPASTVGVTVFLNPPLTLVSKLVLSALVPQVFVFSVITREMVGGVIVLAGLAIAVLSNNHGNRSMG